MKNCSILILWPMCASQCHVGNKQFNLPFLGACPPKSMGNTLKTKKHPQTNTKRKRTKSQRLHLQKARARASLQKGTKGNTQRKGVTVGDLTNVHQAQKEDGKVVQSKAKNPCHLQKMGGSGFLQRLGIGHLPGLSQQTGVDRLNHTTETPLQIEVEEVKIVDTDHPQPGARHLVGPPLPLSQAGVGERQRPMRGKQGTGEMTILQNV